MDIKIITFHDAINYGAVLQTYALYNQIKQIINKDSSVYVFDHKCGFIQNTYRIFKIEKSAKNNIKNIILLPFKLIKKYKFESFIRRNIKLTKAISDNDIFITGSDQVWNYNYTNFDKAYFLNFEGNQNKKIYRNSYAASFGFYELPLEVKCEYKNLLKDFSHISVREDSGREIIKDLLDRDASVVLDPTLLLNKADWMKLCKIRKKNNYVLLYLLSTTQTIISFAENLSKMLNYKVIYITDAIIKSIKNCNYKRIEGPEEWLSLFLNADCIVTNSFHGIAFSINFNKPFFTELLPPPAPVNTRIENILDLFELRSRQIIDGKNDNINVPIDYDKVNSKLDKERSKSINYLKSIIEDINEQD